MEMLQGAWKQHLRPRAVVEYGVKIVLPSPPNYVTRSPGVTSLALFSAMNEEQRVLLLKRELSRLFLVSKMFVPGHKQNKNMVAWRYSISLLVFN